MYAVTLYPASSGRRAGLRFYKVSHQGSGIGLLPMGVERWTGPGGGDSSMRSTPTTFINGILVNLASSVRRTFALLALLCRPFAICPFLALSKM